MTQRITDSNLENLCNHLNDLFGFAHAPYTRVGDKHVTNVGTFYIYSAYSSVGVYQKTDRGDTIVLTLDTKRGLYERMQALISGIGIGSRFEINKAADDDFEDAFCKANDC